MKKHLTIALSAAALLLLATSCQDWFNPEQPSSVNPDRTAEQEFWAVVGQLVGRDQRTDDYEGKTFKPVIGEPDGGDESVRVVAVNDLEAAVARFNTLVGADITSETSTYTYKSKEVGTLTWTKSSDNRSWGVVDVEVPSVPGLRKIIYRSAEQGDVNGSVGDNGSAYYRFGDVIQRTRQDDGKTEYWICVRPAFDKEDKGKSHWVSVSPLPKENVWPYYKDGKPFTASNGFDYGLPYNLGTDLEWAQDLAELLFAIIYPEDWMSNIGQYYSENMFGSPNGLRIFNDFHKGNIKYHNVEFWKNVQKQWKDKNLVQKIFGVSYNDMAKAIDPKNPGRGLHFLYDEYSWNTRFSNKPKLYQVHYSNGSKDTEKNMHLQTKSTPSAQVVKPNQKTESNINYPLDVYDVVQYQPYISESRFFDDAAPRWCIRYAEGVELSENGKFDPQQPIKGFNPDNEFYRYYKHVYPEKNLTEEPEETGQSKINAGYAGMAHYKWGDVYKDENGAIWYVFNESGISPNPQEGHQFNERSVYSELVSFSSTGMELSSTSACVYNLPTLDQAIRAFMWMYNLQQNTIGLQSEGEMEDRPTYGLCLSNILEYAHVDPRSLMLYVSAQNGEARSDNLLCSIAYNGGGVAGRQPLVRCIMNTELQKNNQPLFFFWTNYPSVPSDTELNVKNFSNVSITLQDIAEQQMVDKYAKDAYARLAISNAHPNVPANLSGPRAFRTQAESKAQKVSNYWYDMNLWNNNFGFHKDMWNEPVLVMRYARVKDMGESNYSTTTTDGHRLTLVNARRWTTDIYRNAEENYNEWQIYASLIWESQNDMYLNGQQYKMVTWDKMKD